MRVAFMGKGGSGKTTLAASFITYLTRYKHLYVERCHTWYNAYYGRDLTSLIDPRFTYEQVLANQERSCIV